MITELGHKGTENIHMHGIIWLPTLNNWENQLREIEKTWKYGWIWKGEMKNEKMINYVSAKTINYMIKYISKIDQKHKEYKSKILTSAGIGANYIKESTHKRHITKNKNTIQTYITSTGHEISIPIYWRNKIWTDQEKERLWIEKLDKQERWVCKEKVNIKTGDKEYNKLLKWHRRRNAELGYGSKANENRKQYEEATREIMIQTRIENAKRKPRRTAQNG